MVEDIRSITAKDGLFGRTAKIVSGTDCRVRNELGSDASSVEIAERHDAKIRQAITATVGTLDLELNSADVTIRFYDA